MSKQTHSIDLYIFDMDETLIANDLTVLWHQYLVDSLALADHDFLTEDKLRMAQYYQGNMDLDQYIFFSLSPLSHLTVSEIDELADDFIMQRAYQYIYPQAIELIESLKQAGTACMIISATVTFLVKAMARYLNIEFAEGVNLVQLGDHYSGAICGIPSYQAGKVQRLNQWLELHDNQYTPSHFYSDSINDLPLLLEVPNPIVINGCARLVEEAEKRSWSQEYWTLLPST
ncbi:hypothetical protein BCU68_08725 [Vibrio sp. 10N.286.49.B3]|uniref:HAD family hydrolase n=1 Tax=Vibrio sp. 10N.286.49.B3 TaxID=1880855 RepID=UPI000C82FD5D|nr:HAD family hydrolase [Vibrio sp. 10N.286.49.B3]PMH46146.1 hypothetical protein BCU68_08725 [Vibrio sp. 10N.286.49.B3]